MNYRIVTSIVGRILAIEAVLLLLPMGLSGVGQELINNENDLFPEDDLWYFKILKEKAEGLAQNVNLLSDSMFQLREAYQSMLDIKLNSIMKVLTLITCIFLPPTLITGWFGMVPSAP